METRIPMSFMKEIFAVYRFRFGLIKLLFFDELLCKKSPKSNLCNKLLYFVFVCESTVFMDFLSIHDYKFRHSCIILCITVYLFLLVEVTLF